MIRDHCAVAARFLEDLAANGGVLLPQSDRGDGLARFLIGYQAGADRARCRKLVAELKANTALLRAALDLSANQNQVAA